MIRTALSLAKSLLAPIFVLGFLVALLPGRAAAQQGCNPPTVFATPILSTPPGCPSYLTYFNGWPQDSKSGNSAVAVGDFNNDGKLDVVVALSGGGYAGVGLALMLGNGDSTFQPPTYLEPCCSPDLRSQNWVAVGDFNKDGNLDIVGGNANGYIYILLGNGNGTFQAPFYLNVTGCCTGTAGGAVGDFNGDGNLDLVVTFNQPNPSVAYVFFGDGKGTLSPTPAVISLPSGDTPHGVVVGDFNHDGNLDFATANNTTYYGSVSVVFGNGNGTFQAPVDYLTYSLNPYNPGSRAVSIVAADFNDDNSLDLATLDRDSNEISVFLNNGNGTFSGPTFYGGWAGNNGDGIYPQQIAAADFNHDGKIDLVVTASSFYGAGAAVLFGNGDGTFQQPAASYATDIQLSSVAVGDFNGDGVPDIVASSDPLDTLTILLNKGDGTFKGARDYAPFVVSTGNFGNGSPDPVSVAFGDFNGDGKADMAVANNAALNATVFINNGDGTFTENANYRTDPTNNGYGPNSVTVADLNKDGKLDLVVGGSSSTSFSALLGNGDGTFQPAIVYNAVYGGYNLGGVTTLAVADVNGDGIPDVIFNLTNGYFPPASILQSVYVALGNGDGTFQPPISTSAFCDPWGGVINIVVADLNGDGRPDIAAACGPDGNNNRPSNIFVLLGNGNGTFGPASQVPAGAFPTSIATGDFNEDGKLDLVVANSYPAGPVFSVLLGNGNGTFQGPVTYSDLNSPFWTNWISGTPPNGIPGPVPWPQAFAIGDFNKDGHLDILVADIAGQIGGGSNGGYWNNGVQLFLGSGDGTFQQEQSYLACWHGQAIAAADLTGSGAPSAAVACPPDGVVTVLINQSRPGVSLKSIAVTPANPSVADGNTQQFTATGTYSDNSAQDLTSSVNWYSTNGAAATINSSGLATAVSAGSTTITATLGAVSGNTSLAVTAPVLNSIAVTPANPSVAAGVTQQFTATGTYSDSSTKDITSSVTWVSTNTAAATINSSGLATGVATGSTSITATMGSVSGNTSLAVTAAVLNSIAVTPANPTLSAGNTQQFTAIGTYSDSSTKNLTSSVTWVSSNTAAATMNSSGLATAVATGSSTITATFGTVSGNTSVTVTAAVLNSIAVTPSNPSVAAGNTRQFTATGTYSDSSTKNLTSSVTWVSTNTAAATINSSGLATTVATGNSTITATFGTVSGNTSLTVTAAVLNSIAVTPANPSVAAGNTQQFTATGTYSDSSTKNLTSSVTWASTNGAAATINSSGLANAVATGSTTITATSGAVSGSTSLVVMPPALKSVAVTPANQSVTAGGSVQFTATGTYSDNSTQNLTGSVSWNSTNASVATISSAGLASTVAAGSTTISSTLSGITGQTSLTVNPKQLQSVTVSPLTASVPAGETQQFSATGHYTDGSTQDLTTTAAWTTSNSAYATISSTGLAKGIAVGSMATITATAGGFSGNGKLSVTAAVLVAINLSPSSALVPVGANQQFTATAVYSDQSTLDLTATAVWTSSNTAVAKMNSPGLARAIAAGSATIRASSNGIAGSATLNVTGAALRSLVVTPSSASVPAGLTQQFTATGTYSDGTTANLTDSVAWTATPGRIASISSTGLATGNSQSRSSAATITATLNGIKGTAALTVTAPLLVGVEVSPASVLIPVGTSQSYTARGIYSDGSHGALSSITWASSNTAVATINSSGVATAVGLGTSMITASSSGFVGSATLNVRVLRSVAVTPSPASVAAGLTQQFTATGTYSDGSVEDLTQKVAWASSNTTAATISSTGLASALAVGSTTINATLVGVQGHATLSVTSPVVVSIAVSPTSVTLPVGGSQQYTATGTFSDGSTSNLTTSATWSSSNGGVATVSAGLARVVGAGSATISASSGGKTGIAAVNGFNPVFSVTPSLTSFTFISASGLSIYNAQLTITNTGNVTLSGVSFPSIWLANTANTSKEAPTSQPSSLVNLAPGSSGTINVSFRSPLPWGGTANSAALLNVGGNYVAVIPGGTSPSGSWSTTIGVTLP